MEQTTNTTARTAKNQLIFVLLALLLGAAVGALIWLFFKIMDLGLEFLWETLPDVWDISVYPIIICGIGGLFIGLWQKKFGDYPEELNEVLGTVKESHRYEYRNAPAIAIAAMLPLIFGGSIGPEAGLTGVIAGLCTWVGDRFQHAAKEMKELAQIGISATLSVIFAAPLFGFVAPFESEEESITFPKRAKVILYFAAIFGGMGIYLLLNTMFGGGMGLGRFGAAAVGWQEIAWLIPFALIGTAAGFLYHLSGKLVGTALKPFQRFVLMRAIVGGLLLGTCGFFLPYTMFAGESQMTVVMSEWTTMTVAVLVGTGILKLIISTVCLHTGWKGGNIFPIIFSGVCLGYAMALITGVDSVFAVAVITASLCGAVMRKPIAVILVLLLCFPLKGVISMSAAAFIGASIPLPAMFREKKQAPVPVNSD